MIAPLTWANISRCSREARTRVSRGYQQAGLPENRAREFKSKKALLFRFSFFRFTVSPDICGHSLSAPSGAAARRRAQITRSFEFGKTRVQRKPAHLNRRGSNGREIFAKTGSLDPASSNERKSFAQGGRQPRGDQPRGGQGDVAADPQGKKRFFPPTRAPPARP